LRGAFFEREGGLRHGAAERVERRGALEMGGGISEPRDADIVQVGKDGSDGAATGFCAREFGAPRAGMEISEQELVHRVVDGIGLQENVAKLGRGMVIELGHGSSGTAVGHDIVNRERRKKQIPRYARNDLVWLLLKSGEEAREKKWGRGFAAGSLGKRVGGLGK